MSEEMLAVFIGSSIRLAMPLALAATGELVSERAGVLNMSVEGMMLIGAFGGAIGAWATGSPMLGLAIGVLAVLPVALLQAWLSITLRANQIVTGIGINILVLGGTTIAYREILGRHSRTEIPGWRRAPPACRCRRSARRYSPDLLLYAGLVMIAVAWPCVTWRLAGGATSCEPRAVDKSGCRSRECLRCSPVHRCDGRLAGCFLSIGDIHTFTEGMTNSAGYLALAGIFATGRSAALLAACFSVPQRRCSSSCRRWVSRFRPPC
jgi:simple sugar transport system permease protein